MSHVFNLMVSLTEQDMEVLQTYAESVDLTPESALAYFLMGTLCDRKQIITNVIGRRVECCPTCDSSNTRVLNSFYPEPEDVNQRSGHQAECLDCEAFWDSYD